VVKKLTVSAGVLRVRTRRMRVAALVLAQCAAMCVAHAQSKPDLSGVWQIKQPVFEVKTIDGSAPPFRPGVGQIYQQHIASRRAGDTSFDQATWCASVGFPRIMFIPYPFEIVVRPDRIAFLYTWNWWARVVDMSGADPDVVAPTSMGVATGKWEGGSLVTRTKGLESSTLIDSAGMPHSEQMTVTERFTLKDANILEDRIEIDDAKTFTRPWETLVVYQRKPGAQIQEDVCLDRIAAGKPAVEGDQ
jgi:hypothetical protein